MSSSAAPHPALPALDSRAEMVCTVAEHLVPFFTTGAVDAPLARAIAARAIDAYQPTNAADYIAVARTLAFSMAALRLLGKATAADLALPEQVRAFGRAVALNRSADQSEHTMMQRRRQQQATPRVQQPVAAADLESAEMTSYAAEIEAVIANVMEEFSAASPKAKSEPTAPEAKPEPAAPVMPCPPRDFGPVQPIAAPPSAIRYDGADLDAGQPRAAPYKAELLRHSAMQRVIQQGDALHPR